MASPYLLVPLLAPAVLVALLALALSLLLRPGPVKIPLKGRHVFITGASSGIGLAMARRAAAEGARVSILARDRSKLEAAREEIRRATGADVAVFSADVRDPAALREAVESAGTIDVLVGNQGVAVPRPLAEQSLEDIHFQVDTNLIGMFNLIKAALPGMKKAAAEDGEPRSIALTASEGGQKIPGPVLNTAFLGVRETRNPAEIRRSCEAGGVVIGLLEVGFYGYSVYCATNFAVRGLAEALQMELIGDNIHLSLILPSETDTPGRADEVKRRTSEVTHKIAGTSAFLQPDEVARKAITGIKAGRFIVNVTAHGTLLWLATAGCSPQRSCLLASAEVMLAGLMRFVSLCYLSKFYKMVQAETTPRHAKHKRS